MRGAIIGILAGTTLALCATAAQATQFTGGAAGCFVAPGPGTCSTSTTPAADGGLSYVGGTTTFNQGTNAGGFAGIGGLLDNFGTITLVANARDYGNDLFNLLITFASPAGSGSGSYTANLMGQMTSFGSGGVQIHFANPDQMIAYSGASFLLHVNDVSFSGAPPEGQLFLRQDISGYVQTVPEPATWGMMLLGFGAMGMALRRRRRPALAQIA